MFSPVTRRLIEFTQIDDLDIDLPTGDWIVVWYSRTHYNQAGQVPYCDVLFRRLVEDHPAEFLARRIAISRLGLYQPGYIVVNGQIRARADVEVERFEVDYSKAKFVSRNYARKRDEPIPFSNQDYDLPVGCDDDWLIELPTSQGKLLINCMEFLVRGYSRRSEIPRILSTYEWRSVKKRFFDHLDPRYWEYKDPSKELVIYPNKRMVVEDEYFLAHVAHDENTVKASQYIFAQLDTESFRNGAPCDLQVGPWFKGKGIIEARGYRINNGRDFLCTELVGLSLPEGRDFEVIRLNIEHDDEASDDRAAPSSQPRSTRSDLESVPMTDRSTARVGSQSAEIELADFKVIYPKRHVRRTREITKSSKKAFVPTDVPNANKFATGVSNAFGADLTGRLFISDRDIPASAGGILIDVWNAFDHLKKDGRISALRWMLPLDIFGESLPLSCVEISREGHSWLDLGNGKRRGALLLWVEAQNRKFLVIEFERALKPSSDEKGALEEEKISGFICEIDSLDQANDVITAIFERIADCYGNSVKLIKLLRSHRNLPEIESIRHKSSLQNNVPYESAVTYALNKMGLDLPKVQKITP